ncbi:hypothetical protein [Streptomyces sp. NPDC057428]|uniref:hypothetical protein n=1 Tax=Streptomyces sp. NPDC057428 TaxID=3346129 RepID=UPI0036A47635
MEISALMDRRTPRNRKLLPSIAGVAILAISSLACSAPEKSYETPDSLCGKSVPSKLLDPFMPPGKRVSVVSRNETEGIRRCRIYVDDKEVLSASSEWLNKDRSLLEVAAMAYNNVDPGDRKTKDGKYIYSPTGAIGKVTCLTPPTSSERVFASIRISGGKPNAKALKDLIREYAEELKNSDHCS